MKEKDTQIVLQGLNNICVGWVVEHRFHPVRRWRFDFANPSLKIAIEIEGAVWTQGRHTRGSGFVKDLEKYNQSTLLGWRLLRYTSAQAIDTKTRLMGVDILNDIEEILC